MDDIATPPLVGAGHSMRSVREQIARIGRTEFSVLIEGETGTGKELVARHLHAASSRARRPFVPLNCAALVESLLETELFGIEPGIATGVHARAGRFEQAHQGTLFLDEVADLSCGAQAKLLRVLQDFRVERVGSHITRHVNVRVIAATNQPLAALVAEGRFRADLFYRLNTIELVVPPLRDRPDDVLLLVEHALHVHTLPPYPRVSLAAAEALVTYHWPGNVRELQRAVERALTFCHGGEIQLADLPAAVRGDTSVAGLSGPPARSLAASSSRYARLMYDRCGNNKRLTCRELSISYHTLQRHLRATTS